MKADPRCAAKAEGLDFYLPPPGGIRAGRPRPTRQVQQGAVPPLVVPAPEGYIWVERPCYLLQSPLFRQQQVPMPHGRGWVSTPAECREPRAASRPRPDSPGRKMGAPQDFDSHHCCGAYKARICQRVSLAEAARPKGRPRRTAGKRTAGITGWRSSEAERATYNRLSWVRIPASACYAAGSPQRETQGPLPPVQTPVGRTKGRKTG